MRISLSINGNPYAIDVDDKCYTPVKIGVTENGKEKETALGYFKNLSNAAQRICREEIASSHDTVTLKEYAKRVEVLNKEFLDQLEAVGV